MEQADLPTPLSWEDRARGVLPLPGGYSGYLDSLHQICEAVAEQRPSPAQMLVWIQESFGLSDQSARLREAFLRRSAILQLGSGIIQMSSTCLEWYDSRDNSIMIALLHSRLRFIGEMLFELQSGPQSDEDLRARAELYQLYWNTPSQINWRRGWLESAGMIECTDDRLLKITDEGLSLITRLALHDPADGELTDAETPIYPAVTPTYETPTTQLYHDLSSSYNTDKDLAREIRESSTDSQNPRRLELAVRDAFLYLGFAAEHFGRSGETDVLVKALLGKDDSYTIAVEAKSVGSGTLKEGPVNWASLNEHRSKHNADYSMIVGPKPAGKTLLDRAAEFGVALLSTDQLAGLCLQHSLAPLDLKEYEPLFHSAGEVDFSQVDTSGEEYARLLQLAKRLCEVLDQKTIKTGRLTSRELWILMIEEDLGETSSVEEIQQLLDALASPLVRAVHGDDPTEGYLLATDPRVCQLRLHALGQHLTDGR